MKDKQPSKKKQFEDFARQAISDLLIQVVLLQKNLLAYKRLAKFTDEQIQSEVEQIAKEIEAEINKPTD